MKLNLLFLILLSTFKALCQPGQIDTAFGVNGKITTGFGANSNMANVIAFQPVLTATNGSNTYTGSLSVGNHHNSGGDNPGSDVNFNTAFASPANFAELTDDWDVVTYTSTRIELIDISGGNGGTDHLVFEKN